MNQILSFALKQRVLVVVMLAALMATGLVGFINLNIEAYPDPVPPLVEMVTQSRASRRRKSSATSRSRSRFRWRAFHMSLRFARSPFSASPT